MIFNYFGTNSATSFPSIMLTVTVRRCRLALLSFLMAMPNVVLADAVIELRPACDAFGPRDVLELEREVLAAIPQRPERCDIESLVYWRANAVPTINRLLESRSLHAQYVALGAIESLGPEAGDALPALLGMLRSGSPPRLADRDMTVSAGGAATVHAKIFSAIAALGTAARPALPYLLDVMQNRQNPDADHAFFAYWALTESAVEDRLRAAREILLDQQHPEWLARQVNAYLIETKPQAPDLIPILLARVKTRPDESTVSAYLALQGTQIGVPVLLDLLARPRGWTGEVIEQALRGLPGAEVDRIFASALDKPGMARVIARILVVPMETPRTVAILVQRLSTGKDRLEAARTLSQVRRSIPSAQAPLLRLMMQTRAGDPVRSDVYLKALLDTGNATGIPTSLLLDLVRRDIKRIAKGNYPGCVPVQALRQASPVEAKSLALMERLFRAAAPRDSACLAQTTALIGEMEGREPSHFLYRQLLLPQHDKFVSANLLLALSKHVGAIWPDVENDLDSLSGGQIVGLESLLVEAGPSTVLETHCKRVLPGLLQVMVSNEADRLWRKAGDAAADYAVLGEPVADLLPFPNTAGGIAVRRVARLAPMTASLRHLLKGVAQGPHAEAAREARRLLWLGDNSPQNIGASVGDTATACGVK